MSSFFNRSKRTQHLKHQLLDCIDLIALGAKVHIGVLDRHLLDSV